jgi:hypothetical protein
MVVEIDGVPLHLAHPDELPIAWVGQDEVMRQLLAAWLVINPQDLPMNPRLLGKPYPFWHVGTKINEVMSAQPPPPRLSSEEYLAIRDEAYPSH